MLNATPTSLSPAPVTPLAVPVKTQDALPVPSQGAPAAPAAPGDQNDVAAPSGLGDAQPFDLNGVSVPDNQYADNGTKATTNSGNRGRG